MDGGGDNQLSVSYFRNQTTRMRLLLQQRDQREHRQLREHRDQRDHRDQREQRDLREQRQLREQREQRQQRNHLMPAELMEVAIRAANESESLRQQRIQLMQLNGAINAVALARHPGMELHTIPEAAEDDSGFESGSEGD